MIFTKLNGRLGNQIFQYVLCRIIAEYKQTSFLVNEKYYKWMGFNLFPNILEKDFTYTEYNFNVYKEISDQAFNPNIFNINDNTEIVGYFQTQYYWQNRRNDIKNWLYIDYKKYNLNFDFENTCFIHFRGEDYKYNRSLLPRCYYEQAKTFFPGKKFIIITNDIPFAKEYFPNDDIISINMENDFIILSKAKYKILSASSFSWWATWLGDYDDKIIAPQGWCNYTDNKPVFFPKDISNIDNKKIIYI